MPSTPERGEGENQPIISEYFRQQVEFMIYGDESLPKQMSSQMSDGSTLRYVQLVDKNTPKRIDYHYVFEISHQDQPTTSGIYISQPKIIGPGYHEGTVQPMRINYRMYYNIHPHPHDVYLFRQQLLIQDFGGGQAVQLRFLSGNDAQPSEDMDPDDYELFTSFNNDMLRINWCEVGNPGVNYFLPPQTLIR